MNKYQCKGKYKDAIKNYIEFRASLGYQLSTTQIYLNNFDKFTIENPPKDGLTKVYIEQWLKTGNYKSLKTLTGKARIIKNFSLYLNQHGINAYIINMKYYHHKSNFIPHIYTNDELKTFFSYIEKDLKNNSCFPNKKETIKLLFEILYCCGLRISEALNIKYSDIDIDNSTITIFNSKGHINRIICINSSIRNQIKNHMVNNPNFTYLFTNKYNNKSLRIDTVYKIFHKIVDNCLDTNTYYRIHDLRHTFAVHNLKNWYLNGKDMNAFLPILMTYMGHSHISSTEYYLRFTSDLFSQFIKENETYFNNIIPKKEVDFNE